MTATRNMLVLSASATDLDEREIEVGEIDEITTKRAVAVLYQHGDYVLGVTDLAFYYIDIAREAYFKRESLGLLLERLSEENPKFKEELINLLSHGHPPHISAVLYDPSLPSLLYERIPDEPARLVKLLEELGEKRITECEYVTPKKAKIKREDIEWYMTQYYYSWVSALKLLGTKFDYGLCRDNNEPCILYKGKCYVKVK